MDARPAGAPLPWLQGRCAGGLEAMYCTTDFLVDGLDGETSMACMQFLSNIVRKNLEPPDAGLTH